MGEIKEHPPDFSDPKKWALGYLQKEWHHLKAAPLAFLMIAMLGIVLGWFVIWEIVVPSKSASIETLQIEVAAKQSKIEGLLQENDRITKQNLELKSAISDNAMPLKKRTLILASQLSDFARRCSTNGDFSIQSMEYLERFNRRVEKAVSDLDEAGKHSEVLSTMFNPLSLPMPATNVQTIVKELLKLANSLKDGTEGSL